ncbi:hypothetical protein FRB94_001834 [Tulasnella sp. JGI-2019a]|nr:hypothetical protein FRB93_004282 [Tulasnella sp. JGI-2019a]KAG9005142.1 hypothetical protein FRB94_001834 [Tulasnella sp. JGI-2019a]KAG9028083.1 hypothetical protein FRB95_006847 [Tulasnella sp. JGI-2019a]
MSLSVVSLLALLVSSVSALPQTTAASVTTSSAPAITTAPASVAAAPSKSNKLSYTATYTPGVNLPKTSENGQSGTNQCGTGSNSTSMCQNLYINSVQDFCLWGPPSPAGIANDERIVVAYCLNEGYGTRIFPEGTILGAHFTQTPDYVQITGWGDFTKIGLPNPDEGGELDPHGADGNGNPIGGLAFGNSFGKMQQYHEWTNFMSSNEFCIRACNPLGTNPAGFCNHVYDVMACEWNMPGNYDPGYFEDCEGDSGAPMGVYGTSTFHQGQPATPAAHPAPASSNCVRVASVTPGSIASTPTGASISLSTLLTTSGKVTYVETVATFTEGGASTTGTAIGAASATGTATGAATSTTSAKSSAMSNFVSAPLMVMFVTFVGVMVGVTVAM